jgi:hypothetical protein
VSRRKFSALKLRNCPMKSASMQIFEYLEIAVMFIRVRSPTHSHVMSQAPHRSVLKVANPIIAAGPG